MTALRYGGEKAYEACVMCEGVLGGATSGSFAGPWRHEMPLLGAVDVLLPG